MNDYIAKCPNCGKDYCVMNTTYEFDGKTHCMDCIRNTLENTGKPYFIRHIPNFVDGAVAKCYTFDTIEELIDKINDGKQNRRHIYTYDGNSLMIQSLTESFWWVCGSVTGYDLSNCGIPKSNYCIYDSQKHPMPNKTSEWIDGKKIIYD